MKVINANKAYKECPTRYFDFDRFKSIGGNFNLIEGLTNFSSLEINEDEDYIYLEFDEPNINFLLDPAFNHRPYNKYFDKILSICPYTTEWANQYTNTKHEFVFFPFNEKYIPPRNNKIYDVIYTGNIVSPEITNIIKNIKRFNYRFVSASKETKLQALKRIIIGLDFNNISRLQADTVTDFNVTYKEKISLISKSKIMVVNNLLFPTSHHLHNLQRVNNWEKNQAFSDIKHYLNNSGKRNNALYAPQIKSRVFEAAFSKTLILCKKDSWNVIEHFFTPDIEFVYYDEGCLESSIDKILDDWDNYKIIAKNAYERALKNYTTQVFFNKYLKIK